MSILNPLVEGLFRDANQVAVSPCSEESGTRSFYRAADAKNVVAVLLVIVEGKPHQLAFLEGEVHPFEFTGQQNTRDFREPLSEVVPFKPAGRYFHEVRIPSTVDGIFASVCAAERVKVLEFSPVKEIVPVLTDAEAVKDLFDGVSVLVTEDGGLLTPKLLLCLEQERNHNNPREKAPHRQFGNTLIWTTSGSLHWVTRRQGEQHAVSLQVVAQGIKEYSALVSLLNEYENDRRVVAFAMKMPFYVEKVEPKKEPTQAELDKELIAAADKVRRASASSITNPAVLVSLLSLTHDMINSPIPNVQSVLRGKVENAINEYFVILDGVGGKKRGEIKEGILNALLKADTQ